MNKKWLHTNNSNFCLGVWCTDPFFIHSQLIKCVRYQKAPCVIVIVTVCTSGLIIHCEQHCYISQQVYSMKKPLKCACESKFHYPDCFTLISLNCMLLLESLAKGNNKLLEFISTVAKKIMWNCKLTLPSSFLFHVCATSMSIQIQWTFTV